MFFRSDYSAPGPGVDPDAPEKTGPARFFEIVQLECVTLVKLNLLFLASCIPVVTIPPALFAMDQVVRRMVLDQPVDCLYHYRRAVRAFWKQAYAAFFLTLLPLACSGCGVLFYLRLAAGNPLFFLPFMLCSTTFLAVLLASAYLSGLLGLGLGLRQALRLSLLLGVAKPLRAALAVLACLGPLTAAVLALPLSLPYLLLVGFSLACLLGNFYLRTVLKKYGGGSPPP